MLNAGFTGLPEGDSINDISDRIGLRLSFVATAYLDLYRARMTENQLTPSRVLALAVVKNLPGLEQKDLAESLRINQASAMAMVNKLEALGYVRRARGKDKRSKALYLTDAGVLAYGQACDAEQLLSKELFGDLTRAEFASLDKVLNKIRMRAFDMSKNSDEP